MKFLDTNLSVEDFVAGLLKTEQNLPQLMYDWIELHPDLQQEYLDQLRWMLVKAAEFIEQHQK